MRNKATPSPAKAKADRARDVLTMRYIQRLRIVYKAGNESKMQALLKEAHKAGVSKAVTDRVLDRIRNRGQMEEVIYEGSLPGGSLVLVEALTDKKTRTAPQVRHALSEGGGTLGAAGAAMWAFRRRAMFEFAPADTVERDALVEELYELDGVEDIEDDIEALHGEVAEAAGTAPLGVRVWTAPSTLTALRQALAPSSLASHVSEQLRFVPLSTVALEAEARAAHDEVVDALRALDDVEGVWTNASAA
jgi:transcriptional/translational regulatory protein YebC/TACO1